MNQISILIVDDHKLVRETWNHLLSQDPRFLVIGQADSAIEAVAIAKMKNPDVVLMDINMGPEDGFAITRSILSCSPSSKIIGITMHTNTTYVKTLFRCGAKGYVTKNSSKEEMFEAILEVSRGQRYVCSEIKDAMAFNLLNENIDEAARGIDKLTQRELEIIKLIKAGNPSNEIAKTLGLSRKTIDVHRYNIFRKLNLKNVAELVNFANMNCL